MAATPRHLPGHLSRLIEDAGASALAWYEEEAVGWVDPNGRWRYAAKWLARAWGLGLAVGLFASTLLMWTVPGYITSLLVVVGYLVRRGRSVHWVSSVAVVAVTYMGTGPGPALVIGWGAAGAWLLMRAPAREHAVAAAAIIVGVLRPLGESNPGEYQVLMPVVAVSVLVLWGYLSGPRPFPRPWVRLAGENLGQHPQSPPSRLPWLVRLARRRQIEALPNQVTRKKVGAYGERKTAVALLGLARGRGTRIAHDVMIPGADMANADHVVAARSGLFVIDSKQFGSAADPGKVVHDPATGRIVHQRDSGTRPIESSLKTAAWAARGISALVEAPAVAVLAIHGAQVEQGLRAHQDGVQVEVIPAWALVDRVDHAPAVMSARLLRRARLQLARLQSATRHGAPEINRPRGLSRTGQDMLSSAARQSLVLPLTVASDTAALPPAEPSAPVGHRTDAQGPQGHARTAAASHGAETAAARSPALVLSAQEHIEDLWQQVQHSEVAAPDEVPDELRLLRRGSRVLLIDVSETNVTSKAIFAMSPVCRGVSGTYIWFCAPEQYRIFTDTGTPVRVGTISTEKIMLIPEDPR